MYGLIWRMLPGGRLGKTVGSLVLLGAAAAFLWYAAFPWIEAHVPLDQAGSIPEVTPRGD